MVARSEVLVSFPTLEAGRYDIICTVPGHEKMVGLLTVTDATD